MYKILVVDDNEGVQASVARALRDFGYDVVCEGSAEEARDRLTTFEPNLIILDIMLPGGMSGHDFLREIRASLTVPVIFLSGLDEAADRTLGIEIGADDYLSKPFDPAELRARVKARLRRAEPTPAVAEPDSELRHGPLRVDVDRFEVDVDGGGVDLTKTQFLMLRTLMLRPHNVHTRDNLRVAVYGSMTYVSDKAINSHMKDLRKKLTDAGHDPVETVRGVGYRIREGG